MGKDIFDDDSEWSDSDSEWNDNNLPITYCPIIDSECDCKDFCQYGYDITE